MIKLGLILAAIALAVIWHTPAAGVILFGTLLGVSLVAMYQGTKDAP